MIHTKNAEHRTMIDFIALLNDIGYNVAIIDNSFYVFSAFIPVDDIINEIEVIGKDITFLVENEVATASTNTLKRNELITRIDEIKSRRRQFHPDTVYVKYLNS